MSSIPPNAKRVFKGVIFEVWQWEQKMYDGSMEIFEMLKRPDTVVVIPIVDDKILIQNQEQPHEAKTFVSLPGGRMDKGEEPLAAAKREMLEETGYASRDWTLWKTQEPYGKMDWTIYTYIARDCKNIQEPKPDSGEKIVTKLVTFDEFMESCVDRIGKDLGDEGVRARFDEKFREELRSWFFRKK